MGGASELLDAYIIPQSVMKGFITQLVRNEGVINLFEHITPQFKPLLADPGIHINTIKWAWKNTDHTITDKTPPQLVIDMISSHIIELKRLSVRYIKNVPDPTDFLKKAGADKTLVQAVKKYYTYIVDFPPDAELYTTTEHILQGLVMYCSNLTCVKEAICKLIKDFGISGARLGNMLGEQTCITAIQLVFDELISRGMGVYKTMSYKNLLQRAASKGNLVIFKYIVVTAENPAAIIHEHIKDIILKEKNRERFFTIMQWLIESRSLVKALAKALAKLDFSLRMITDLNLDKEWLLSNTQLNDTLVDFIFVILERVGATGKVMDTKYTTNPASLLSVICCYIPDVELAKTAVKLGAVIDDKFIVGAMEHACINNHKELVEYLQSLDRDDVRITSCAITSDIEFTKWAFNRWQHDILRSPYEAYHMLVKYSHLSIILGEVLKGRAEKILEAVGVLIVKRHRIYELLECMVGGYRQKSTYHCVQSSTRVHRRFVRRPGIITSPARTAPHLVLL